MTALGGIGHTLPFLLKDFREALWAAGAVVLVELGSLPGSVTVIWIVPGSRRASGWVGGVLVFITGVLIGNS